MNKIALRSAVISLAIFFSCSPSTLNIVEIKNEMKGKLNTTVKLILLKEKKFSLDSVSAPRPQYIQIFEDSDKCNELTFLNTYASAIYLYDYKTLELKKIVKFNKEGKNGIRTPLGYFIKNFDSIYIYNKTNNELVLINDLSKVLSRISLINNHPFHELSWTYYYPQYFPTTVAPLIGSGNQLIFPGQYMLSLPDTIAERFKFEAHIDINNNTVSFFRQYPMSLYGHNYFWENEGLFTNVYYDLTEGNKKIVYSFPVSHNLFLGDKNKEGFSVLFGGSNEAGTISSFRTKLTPEDLVLRVCKTDLYAAIKYDKYRKVYYRFLRKAIPNATYSSTIFDKPLAVLIMDENFKHLGETTIGTCNDFKWENSFITEEGLNIEYIDKNDLEEANLYFKIFKPVKID